MIWVSLCLAYFVLAAWLHAAVRRMRPGANTVAVFLVVGAASGIALVISLRSIANLPVLCVAAGAFLYAFLCELYIFAFTFAFGSVSAEVLLAHLDGGLTARDGSAASQDVMIRRRLSGMCASGLLLERSGAYEITGKGRLAARADRVLGGFFRHERAASTGHRGSS
jgi:hypothetical protein